MNTTTTTDSTPAPVYEHGAHVIEQLNKYRRQIDDLLKFSGCNSKQLRGLEWSACHIYLKIEIQAGLKSERFEHDARAIARRWVGAVWTRQRNVGVCGVLDWHATIDGVLVIIRNAEGIKWSPMPNTEVEP